jgi:hypothetical protein
VLNNRRYALTFICVCNWDCFHDLASTVCESCVTHFSSLCCTSPLWQVSSAAARWICCRQPSACKPQTPASCPSSAAWRKL